ncbi:MAG: hypothetical protein M3461_08810 [Pseudomonadota bacterium]|nr:hypothetical protein [Pseudomonadota bacterium]
MAQLAHIGGLRPARRLEPVAAEPWAYRRRARLTFATSARLIAALTCMKSFGWNWI